MTVLRKLNYVDNVMMYSIQRLSIGAGLHGEKHEQQRDWDCVFLQHQN